MKITKQGIAILFVLCNIFYVQFNSALSQEWDWAKDIGTLRDHEYVRDVVTDTEGNIFITGHFIESLKIGDKVITANHRYKEIFIAKFDTEGNLLWVKQAGSDGYDEAQSIAADQEGNVYITGSIMPSPRRGNIFFDDIELVKEQNRTVTYTAKYDSDGNVIWAKIIGYDMKGSGITLDESGNIYLIGSMGFNFSFSGYPLYIAYYFSEMLFVAKMDNKGDIDFVSYYSESIYTSKSHAITIDENGNIYVSMSGSSSTIILNFDSNGILLWELKLPLHSWTDTYTDITLGDNHLYIAGTFAERNANFGGIVLTPARGGRSNDIYLTKVDISDGSVVWAKRAGGYVGDEATGIAIDKNENLYITGRIHVDAEVNFDNILINRQSGGDEFYVAKYDSAGNALWVKVANTVISADYGSKGWSVDVSDDGSIYCVGYYRGGIALDSTYLPWETRGPTSESKLYLAKITDANNSIISDFRPKSGFWGETVFVEGLGFSQTHKLYFGDVEINEFTIQGDTVLSFTVPENVESNKIKILTAGGMLVTSSKFNIIQPPKIHDFLPVRGKVGDTISVTGENLSAAINVFLGSKGTNFTVLSDALVEFIVPENANTGKIKILTQSDSVLSEDVFEVIPNISINTTINSVTCKGTDDGKIEAIAYGGEGLLLYSLDNQTFTQDGTFTGLEAGEYTVFVKGDTPDYVESVTVEVTEPEALKISLLTSISPKCPEDLDGFLEVTATGGTGTYTFQLNNASPSLEPKFFDLDAGIYNITVTDRNGCTANLEVDLNYLSPTPEKPVVSIINGIESITDILKLSTSSIADIYQWYVNGEAIEGANEAEYEVQSSDFTDNASSSFSVEVGYEGGCSITSDILTLTSDADEIFKAGITTYPNPVKNAFFVRNDLFTGKKLDWHLYNSNGIEMPKSVYQISDVKYQISTSNLPSGLYLLLVKSTNAKAVLKIQIN